MRSDLVAILSNGQPAMKMSERVVLWLNHQINKGPGSIRLKTLRLPPMVVEGLEYEIGPIPHGHVMQIMGAEVKTLQPPTGPYWVCADGNKEFRGVDHPHRCGAKHLGSCDWRGPFQDAA